MYKEICILGGGFISGALALYFGNKACVIKRSDLDLTNSESTKTFFRNNTFDYVILCASIGGSRIVPDPLDTVEQNIKIFMNVEAHSCEFKKLIWFSSGAYMNTKSRYGFSKRILERIWAGSPKNVFCLRIFGCFGVGENGTRFLTTCVRDGHVIIDGDCYFDMIAVNDLCKIIEYIFYNDVENRLMDAVYREKWKLSELAKMIGAIPIVNGYSEEGYTGNSGIEFMQFEPMPLLLQKFREDYIHNQRQQETCRDVHPTENPDP